MVLAANPSKNFAILVHSGVTAKFLPTNQNSLRLQATLEAAKKGFTCLVNGSSSDEAVKEAIMVMESSNNTNSGLGSVPQLDGEKRMDASLMNSQLDVGAVGSLRGFENPIAVCEEIIQDSKDHVFYAHDFAAKLAEKNSNLKKIPLENEDNFLSKHDVLLNDGNTVGAVGLDKLGNLTAGTSTGGRGNCKPGRIGDSCVIGAGTYCNKNAAVSNTGFGEWVIRLNCAKRIVDLIQEQHYPPQAAIDRVHREYQQETDSILGSISIDQSGKWGIGITGGSMGWALIIQSENSSPMLYYGLGKGQIVQEQYFVRDNK